MSRSGSGYKSCCLWSSGYSLTPTSASLIGISIAPSTLLHLTIDPDLLPPDSGELCLHLNTVSAHLGSPAFLLLDNTLV